MTQRNAEFQSYANKWQAAKESTTKTWFPYARLEKMESFGVFPNWTEKFNE